jgi:putative transposase
MTNNNVIKLAQPGTFIGSLTEILRGGARALLTQAVEGGDSSLDRRRRGSAVARECWRQVSGHSSMEGPISRPNRTGCAAIGNISYRCAHY